MKRCVLGFWVIVIGFMWVSIGDASCSSSCPFQQIGGGVSGVKDAGPWINGLTQNFWCLSDSSDANDEGSAANWWQQYMPGVWYISGNWAASGVDGCCGMLTEGFDSMSMAISFWQDFNPLSVNHSGLYFIAAANKDVTNGMFRLVGGIYPFAAMPVPDFSGAIVGGGNVSISLSGWRSGSAVNYYYWPGNNDPGPILNGTPVATCSPGRTSACPAIVYGYNLMSIEAPCTGATTGIASNWTNNAACQVVGRTGVPSGVCNIATTNTQCIFLATQVVLADGEVSYYVSANSIGIWTEPLGGEIFNLAANYVSRSDIKVAWNSVVEGNVAGFNVYRSYSATGTFTKINARTIPAVGADGSSYLYKDKIISPTKRNIYYKVEIVRPDGSTEMQPDIAVAKI